MKKSLVVTLALVFVLGIAGTAFAAANPFVDVPAKHWAYDAVAKLAQAGVIDGYGDGTFRGDRTMTRYEMAQIVAKAMAHSDKQNAETKALVDKLAVEFNAELQNLGVRVAKLEAKQSNIKFTGEYRARYEYNKDQSVNANNDFQNRFRIFMTAPLDEQWTLKARYDANFQDRENTADDAKTNSNITLGQAYVTGKAFNLNEVTLGRMPVYLGKGLLMDESAGNDGVRFGFGNELKATVGVFKKTYTTADAVAGTNQDDRTFYMGQLAWAPTKTLDFTAAYLKDNGTRGGDAATTRKYDSYAFGTTYKGIENFTVTGEWAKNRRDGQDTANPDANAWYAKLLYKGADKAKPGSFGIYTFYRDADNGFDPKGYGTIDSTKVDGSYEMNNIKGWSYGIEYTFFKNSRFDITWNATKVKSTDADKKDLIANMYFYF